MEEKNFRPTWVEIDLDAIKHNIKQIEGRLPEDCQIIAVVKANAYGHGSVEVARTAITAGARMLAVAMLEEAIELRMANINVPILVLGWVDPLYAPIAAKHDIMLTCFQVEWLRIVKQQSLDKELKIHMKWDTGMGRIGIRTEEELLAILEEIKEQSTVLLTGIYTHFATADEKEEEYFAMQNHRFEQLLTVFQEIWDEPVMIHTGNSAAATRYPDKMHNLIRLGISMYGLHPSAFVKQENKVTLKEAFSLHSRLIHVKKVPSKTAISYGNSYITEEEEWIGTVPIGYADGWNRKLQNAHVLINGKRQPIVGRVCMDQLMIRLDQEYPIGTMVTLIGKQGNQSITMDEIASHLDTINYEIPCMINERIPRIFGPIK